jgi:hypothetical protein
MGIFDRLGYNPSLTGNNVTQYSDSVIKHMDTLPPMLSKWQQDDIANNAVGGYFKNPVANVVQQIWDTSNTIIAITGLNTTNISQVYVASSNLSQTSANNFMAHTGRISGVQEMTPNTATLPHYTSAMNVGKLLSYIVYQSDGVQNNAPIMGNFTSLFTEDALTVYYNIIKNYPNTIQHSIITTIDPDTLGTVYSSNLTQTVANAMKANLNSICTYMDTRVSADVNFYNNSQNVVNDYHSTKQFSNMGGTQTDLVNNFVGSDKLKSRINS